MSPTSRECLATASLIPKASAAIPRIYISQAMRHPNVFRRRISRVEGNPQPGDWVAIYSEAGLVSASASRPNSGEREPSGSGGSADAWRAKNNDAAMRLESESRATVRSKSGTDDGPPALFAYGIYNPKSTIAVRMMSWGEDLPDAAFWQVKIHQAISLRTGLLQLDQTTNAYRVIHGEADGFPGIVVDRYGDCLSAEVFSLGMWQRSVELMRWLCDRLGVSQYIVRPCPGFESQEGYTVEEITSDDAPQTVTIQEGTTKYKINFGSGHKTGFFCDQRENREQLAQWCAGKSVLDVCCYTGGFSIKAASQGGASDVTGVDIDEEPLKLAKKNANINNVRVKFSQNDAFAFMRDMLAIDRKYDIVILDPPKLIRTRNEIEEGTRKHHDLNKLAMQLVTPGGLMLSCSCAGLLSQEGFASMIHAATRSTGKLPDGSRTKPRTVQILRRNGASADHPVAVHCPETEYFKSVWMRIDD